MKESENFVESIHNENYEEQYLTSSFDNSNLIYDFGREKELLNGDWNFHIDQYDTCLRAKWYEENYKDKSGRFLPVDFDFDNWDTLKVPSCWNTQDEKYFYYEGPGVYTRKFRYINNGEERVYIKFGAINYEAKIFLNKKYLGYHRGGSTPFFVEVTGLLQEENRILVVADNTRKSNYVPSRNTDWFNYGGIYRDVELIRLPESFIKDFHIGLVPDSNYKKIKVKIGVEGCIAAGEAKIEIEELNILQNVIIADGYGEIVLEAEPQLWCPENPKLYDVRVNFCKDSISEKIGFREIRVEGREILLNGKGIFLKGVCCHEESVVNGKAISDEEIRENFRVAKEMNCNFMRLTHYTHTERAAQIADEMGIMLWEEIPVYWAIYFKNESTYQDAENQLCEMIKRDRNRASVIVWSVGNENEDTDARLKFMSSLALKAREIDSSRLVSAACLIDHVNLMIKDRLANFLDIIGVNEYYGWYDPDFTKLSKIFYNSNPDKPIIVTEFGADATAHARGTIDDLGTEDCQLNIYKKQISVLGEIPYIKGMTPWLLYDFRSPRRINNLQRGYNVKGLLSEDKKYKKPSYFLMKKFYETK
jgi:beta-glucuronidase